MKRRIILCVFLLALSSFSIWAQSQAIVISKQAQIREIASRTGKVISTLKKDTKLKLKSNEHKNGWYNVSVLNGDQKGWIHGNDIKILDNDVTSTEWKLIDFTLGQNQIKGYYSYRPNIVKISPNLYKAWVKYENLEQDTTKLMLFEMNCKSRQFRPTEVIDYDSEGKIIKRVSNPNSEFRDVIPETMSEAVFTMICSEIAK